MPVYMIRSGPNGPVKIGWAEDVGARMGSLQTGNPDELSLLREIDRPQAVESWLHWRYTDHRIRGEWFAFVDDMLTVEPPHFVVPGPTREPRPAAWQRARDIRLALGWTQTEMARELGVTQATVSRLETGGWTPSKRDELALDTLAHRAGISPAPAAADGRA